ncbi:ADP-heptose--LPS heptosyltransferase RfaF [Flavobacteriales bacterium 33_180_T64]|nr:ADP-heptose--LPS heptosyltransferase RfaF [Flavobacteriales bacterium 33_180_T64]
MGDVAMTVPVLRALSSQHPNLKITVLTRSFFKPFFEDIPNVYVFEADIKGKHKGVLGLWKLSKALKKLKFDVVADLHNVLRSKVLKFFFFGKKVIQINKGRQEKSALVNGELFEQLKTTHQRYADVFKQLGFQIDLNHPIFPKKESLNSKSIQHLGTDSKKWIGIAPFAAFEGKMYPLDLMEKVIENLLKEYKVILFGAGNDEAKILDRIADQYDGVINLAGKFLLDEELDVISNLDLMLAMDSGNAHLAAMLGVKVITIWGVTHPYAGFLPFNHTIDSAILADKTHYPKIPTSVYGNKLPEGYENAMRSISPKQIISKVLDAIK